MSVSMTLTGTTVTVPAGRYFLCDPCYVIDDADWMGFLDRSGALNNDLGRDVPMVAEIRPGSGFDAVALSTAFGDGLFTDGDGEEYGVDAGLIGLVPVAYNPAGSERIVEFDVPTDVFVEVDGASHVLVFGKVRIETGEAPVDDPCTECGEEATETCPQCHVDLCYGCVTDHCEPDEDDDEDES